MTVVGWLEPVFQGVQASRVGFRNLVLGFVRGPFLLEENLVLRSQLAASLAHEETHKQLSEENARLRNLLDFKEKSPWRLIPAEVIGREFGLWSRTLLLNKGKEQGIKSGMAIVTAVGLVGRIGEVGSTSSRAILITDPHFRVSATVLESRDAGLIIGNASGECLLTYVPHQAEIKPGQSVQTTGGKSFCPPGIPVGSIQTVSEDPSNLFRSARIKPSVSLAAVEEVLVVAWSQSDSGW